MLVLHVFVTFVADLHIIIVIVATAIVLLLLFSDEVLQ